MYGLPMHACTARPSRASQTVQSGTEADKCGAKTRVIGEDLDFDVDLLPLCVSSGDGHGGKLAAHCKTPIPIEQPAAYATSHIASHPAPHRAMKHVFIDCGFIIYGLGK